ncbi:hypothetical protein SAMN06295905_1314 [Devosia lucknowensis]|uniref:Uncharacterized protein n=1 Tax=Devosia lucknowensis TaxID=1096929 RepID=A0A1Y6ESR9_9HYPH|nr:hypothetical protein [Devosia lucknowensis]SMQ65778.1 hypothetical protein SAMN06295905_1314 [Devosia lucknowensis]
MLGQFWYQRKSSDSDVVVHLKLVDGHSMAKVSAPERDIEKLVAFGVALPPFDDYMQLPFALSYAVLIACYGPLNLTISGDQNAWPDQWGNLLDGQFREFRIAAPIGRTAG